MLQIISADFISYKDDNRKLFCFSIVGLFFFPKILEASVGKKLKYKSRRKKALEMFNNEMKKAFCEMKFWTK